MASADLAGIKAGLTLAGTRYHAKRGLVSLVAEAEAALENESIAWEQLVWRDVREARRERLSRDEDASSGA